MGAHWWWNGRKLLPWLQKTYIASAFPGYKPLTDNEDDLPYDVDHICPYNDWGYWPNVRDRVAGLDASLVKAMRDGRDAIGNGIGNLRLIDASQNKSHQDADVGVKMPFVLGEGPAGAGDENEMSNWLFSPEQLKLWRRVSGPVKLADRQWNNDRLAAFQAAVERRAAWLYRRFHDDLGYESWTSK